jgi:hypothetical protein
MIGQLVGPPLRRVIGGSDRQTPRRAGSLRPQELVKAPTGLVERPASRAILADDGLFRPRTAFALGEVPAH